MDRTPEYSGTLAFLLSQIGAETARRFGEALAPTGVSPRAFGVLTNLAADEGQSQQQLADALGLHRNNMVDLVDELERAGWVARTRSERDRRAFALSLTDAGRAAVARTLALVPPLDAELAAALSEPERAVLTDMLRRIAAELGLTAGVHPHLRGRPRSRSMSDR